MNRLFVRDRKKYFGMAHVTFRWHVPDWNEYTEIKKRLLFNLPCLRKLNGIYPQLGQFRDLDVDPFGFGQCLGLKSWVWSSFKFLNTCGFEHIYIFIPSREARKIGALNL